MATKSPVQQLTVVQQVAKAFTSFDKPVHTVDLQKKMGRSRSSVSAALTRMTDYGLVKAGKKTTNSNGVPSTLYSLTAQGRKFASKA